jgi:hypothetical protein
MYVNPKPMNSHKQQQNELKFPSLGIKNLTIWVEEEEKA